MDISMGDSRCLQYSHMFDIYILPAINVPVPEYSGDRQNYSFDILHMH